MTDDRYASGTYLSQHPTLHEEDSVYKMRYLAELLCQVPWQGHLRVLDIGGGAGTLSRLVCEWFVARGHAVSCWALDLSEAMLARQRANNPYIVQTRCGGLEQLAHETFDLVLLIDVIEHIGQHHDFAARVNAIGRHILYNVPVERNLCDWLRDKWMGGRYYPLQTASLGHVHFFTPRSAKSFVAKHHELCAVRVPHFARHALTTEHPSYDVQRRHRIRLAELKVSGWIRRFLPGLAPWLVQGSLFMLARARRA
jgi:SAM-dependent methyltransferase